jgi:hypothetical protein
MKPAESDALTEEEQQLVDGFAAKRAPWCARRRILATGIPSARLRLPVASARETFRVHRSQM